MANVLTDNPACEIDPTKLPKVRCRIDEAWAKLSDDEKEAAPLIHFRTT